MGNVREGRKDQTECSTIRVSLNITKDITEWGEAFHGSKQYIAVTRGCT